MTASNIIIFSDLDGCLLNKADYSFAAAKSVLKRIQALQIPLVLASSKTESEMRTIADEMKLADAPLICENGGAIFWSRSSVEIPKVEDDHKTWPKTVLGAERVRILEILRNLKAKFQFESFEDMGIEGVMKSTDLPKERAEAALARSSTEPLLWHDDESKIEAFRSELMAASLTLTRGGRFWHVAGKTDKGLAMQEVRRQYRRVGDQSAITLAIGDSPIDQGMLDVADYPIGIPAPDGVVHVTVNAHNGRISSKDGAAGWAESVTQVLDELNCD